MDNERELRPDEEDAPSKSKVLRHFLIFMLTLLLVLAVIIAAAYRDGTGFDVLRRYFSYGSKAAVSHEYTYDANRNNRFALLGEQLAVVSNTAVQLLDGSAEPTYAQSVKLAAPAVTVGKNNLAAYDVGGSTLAVCDGKRSLLEYESPPEEPVIAATMNHSDYLAVTTQKKGYKGAVAVYNNKMELIFEFNSSDRFVSDAIVTEDCKHMAAVTLGQENGTFVSNVVLYPLDSTEPSASYDVLDGLVLHIGSLDGKIATVADTKLTFADTNGKIDGEYTYDGAFLREYDLHGEGFAALLLNRYQSGSAGKLVTVNAAGEELASLAVTDEILNLSAAGRYLAVLYADSLVVYTSDLQEYAKLESITTAKDVRMRRDGSALLLGSDRAELYIP